MALSEIFVLILKLSLIIPLSSLSVAHPSPNINSSFEDQQSLISFQNSISYDPFNALQDWNSSVIFCNWTGVTCDIPRERVIELRLSGMGLHGFLSSHLGNLSSLERLDLYNNTLGGHIPPQLGRLSSLRELRLRMNQLEGTIPSSLSNCQNLVILSLSHNHLTGLIPPQLGQLTKLRRLFLYENKLIGTIPSSLSNISTLTYLDLFTNNLSGAIPPRLGMLTRLEYLALSDNQLTGQIPASLSNCTLLFHLGLYDNQLAGHIPSEFGAKLAKLQWLWVSWPPSHLGDNHLTGVLPVSIGQLPTKLNYLNLHGNNIGGEIPQQIANLTNLTYLALSGNSFTGRIPSALRRLQKLERFYLAFNKLEGSIPGEIGQQTGLGLLSLSGNMLEGRLPPEVGKMIHVLTIDISKNKLRGKIPATIESCSELQSLNLSWNALHGPIPNSLAQLKSLEDVDLSYNNLSGSIPKSLEKLGMLRHLNLSFNNFSGEIPRAGFFTNLTVTSFKGNPGLCGQWLNMPPCSTPSRTKQRDHALVKEIVIPIVSIICFILCISLVSRFLCSRWQKSKNALALNVEHSKISHRELIDATNGFDEANLLGVGSFGAVYKAIFRDGRMAAVKVLNLQNEEAHKSFSTECKALGRVRHRNLVTIITSCSNLQFKALVLEFMPSGSLEKHLYSDNVCELNLRERVKIAIDIAHAVEYLHHHSPVEVVHCDLKPANVLLDENMTAHVADFGIARITCANSMDLYTSTIKVKGTVGYIAPEYGQGGMVSAKGDVYSYGILLLEMLTRRRPTDDMFSGGLNLQKWVNMAFPERMVEVVDECLFTNVSLSRNVNFILNDDEQDKIYECVREMMGVGLACTKEMPQQRPEMRDVVGALESIREAFVGSTWTSRFTPSSTIEDLLHNNTNARWNGSRGVDGQSYSSSTL
eukprot:Gb_34076 [translate_table: standard]